MNGLLNVLMDRDELSQEEATELIQELKNRMNEGENREELLFEIGLEPDYIMDLFD